MQDIEGTFLIDTGASRSVISRASLSRFRPGVSLKIAQVRLESVTGEPVEVDGQVSLTVDGIGGHSFLVLKNIKGNGIIGSDFLTARGANVDYDKGQLRLGRKCMPLFR